MVLSILLDDLIDAGVTSCVMSDLTEYRVVMYCSTLLGNGARDVQVEQV
jgi:hypothetical protein